MLKDLLSQVGLPDTANRIYRRLVETGPCSARHLAEHLGIPRPTVYDNLKILLQQALVVRREEDGKTIFQVDDLRHLPHLAQGKIEVLVNAKKGIEALLPTLTQHTQSPEPKIKFYAGVEGVKHVMQDMLWYDHIETLTMWPISEMVEVLGSDYLAELNRKRIRRSISIRGILPHNKTVPLKDYPFLGIGKGHLRELRVAPKTMSWNMSYWLYADKVAFISSRNESFGYLIHSRDFTELMKAQFETIWPLCKPVTPKPEYTDSFLKTI